MIYLFFLLFFFIYLVCFLLFIFIFLMGSLILDFFWFFYNLEFSIAFIFDFLSLGFFGCVSFISGVVFLYSIFYMGGTVDMRRVGWMIFLFVISMFLLVFSGNFFLTLVGWDGLGLVSFCLVIFYSNSFSLDSGLITVFSNRVGDVFFLISFWFFFMAGWLNFDFFSNTVVGVFVFLIFFGSVTKSAQVPFSAWLPAAMAAPTPVSSLVHSSTLVTAGIYVLIRFNYIFFYLNVSFLKILALFTMVVAGASACLEKDFKKVVAMSTLSQLGMMLFILVVGLWVLTFIHMIIHAFFKSMLFLSTGSLMLHNSGAQDSRFYGSAVSSYISFTYFLVSSFCLSGFPFFIGFYSKDFIIGSGFTKNGLFYFYFFLVGCLFTVSYSLRLVLMGYMFMFNSFSLLGFYENSIFFNSVLMLFFKGWLLGGFFYWFFLVDLTFFFYMFDLLLGIFLFGGGIFLYFFLSWGYLVLYSLSKVYFLCWISSSNFGVYFNSMFFYKLENSWMEIFGGGGTYKILSGFSVYMGIFEKVGLGSLVLVSFLGGIYFF